VIDLGLALWRISVEIPGLGFKPGADAPAELPPEARPWRVENPGRTHYMAHSVDVMGPDTAFTYHRGKAGGRVCLYGEAYGRLYFDPVTGAAEIVPE